MSSTSPCSSSVTTRTRATSPRRCCSRPTSSSARPGPFNARAWLYRVTVNACFDHLRARRRKPVFDLEGRAEPAAAVNEFEQAELQRHLGRALRRLPPAQRTALMLREVHGLPVDEVAFVLGVQTDSAAVTLSRARSSFRRQFLAVANGAATELGEKGAGGVAAAGGARRRRARRGGASAGLVVGVGLGLPSLSWPALPLPASLEASSLLPALAPAAPAATLAAPAAAAGAAGGGAAVGVIGKIAAALSTKAAAVAVGASLVAGGVGGAYTAERAATSTRHAGAVAQASGAHAVDKALGGGNAASPRPSPRSTVPAYALASPSPGTSPSVSATVSAAPRAGPVGDDARGDGRPYRRRRRLGHHRLAEPHAVAGSVALRFRLTDADPVGLAVGERLALPVALVLWGRSSCVLLRRPRRPHDRSPVA